MDPSALLLALLLTGPPWPEPDPLAADLLRFPGPEAVRLEMRRAWEYRKRVDQAAEALGWPAEVKEDYLDRLMWLREPWDLLESLHDTCSQSAHRRTLLRRLRERLGPDLWWAGAVPSALPGEVR